MRISVLETAKSLGKLRQLGTLTGKYCPPPRGPEGTHPGSHGEAQGQNGDQISDILSLHLAFPNGVEIHNLSVLRRLLFPATIQVSRGPQGPSFFTLPGLSLPACLFQVRKHDREGEPVQRVPTGSINRQ